MRKTGKPRYLYKHVTNVVPSYRVKKAQAVSQDLVGQRLFLLEISSHSILIRFYLIAEERMFHSKHCAIIFYLCLFISNDHNIICVHYVLFMFEDVIHFLM